MPLLGYRVGMKLSGPQYDSMSLPFGDSKMIEKPAGSYFALLPSMRYVFNLSPCWCTEIVKVS